nr:hypothetical protein CFP56_31497 [Quercus suber]
MADAFAELGKSGDRNRILSMTTEYYLVNKLTAGIQKKARASHVRQGPAIIHLPCQYLQSSRTWMQCSQNAADPRVPTESIAQAPASTYTTFTLLTSHSATPLLLPIHPPPDQAASREDCHPAHIRTIMDPALGSNGAVSPQTSASLAPQDERSRRQSESMTPAQQPYRRNGKPFACEPVSATRIAALDVPRKTDDLSSVDVAN